MYFQNLLAISQRIFLEIIKKRIYNILFSSFKPNQTSLNDPQWRIQTGSGGYAHSLPPSPPPPRIRPVGFFTTYTNSKILTMIGWCIPTLYVVFVIQLSCNMSWLIWAITKKTIKGFLCLQIESLDLLPKFSGPPPPSNPYRC